MEGRENIDEIEEKTEKKGTPAQRLRYRNQSARWSDHNYNPNCPPHNIMLRLHTYVRGRQNEGIN